jgi:hypothetical protein
MTESLAGMTSAHTLNSVSSSPTHILGQPSQGALSLLPADTLAGLGNSLLTTQKPAAPSSQGDPATPETASPAPPAGQGRAANKYITLSFIHESKAALLAKPTLNLLDIAKLNEATQVGQPRAGSGLDEVENALQQALLREWEPPPLDTVPHSQRRVTVNLVILRDGLVKEVVLQTPSGSKALDASVRSALDRIPKIAKSLPSSFPKESYPLRVNLLIE